MNTQQEYRQQRYYYEDSDGSIRNGYDTDEELAELDKLLQPTYHEFRPEDWANNEYKPTKRDILLFRMLTVTVGILLGLLIWLLATIPYTYPSS